MIGRAPDCQPFRDMFNWPDALIEISPDGSDMPPAAGMHHRENTLNALAEHGSHP